MFAVGLAVGIDGIWVGGVVFLFTEQLPIVSLLELNNVHFAKKGRHLYEIVSNFHVALVVTSHLSDHNRSIISASFHPMFVQVSPLFFNAF
jgi:hypothetical protein